jgi:enoyl-CoA hydratase/carnithine racemase
MTESHVLRCQEGSAAIITLNRPDKLNALSMELLKQLGETIDDVAADKAVRTIIINGEGKAFCAGIDVMSLAQHAMGLKHADFRRLVRSLQDLHNKLARVEKPVIAVLHRYCLGMGLELALACDVRLAEEGTELHIGETRLGMIPDVGGSTRLVRAVGLPRAKELIMTGKSIDVATAERWGLVNEVVPAGEGMAAALRWRDEFEQAAPLAVGLAKFVLERAFDLDIHTAQQVEALAQSTLFGTEDMQEGVMARMEKRAPNWKGK